MPYDLLHPIPSPTQLWMDVTMDFITNLPSSKSISNIMVVVDRFSKAAHFVAIQSPLPGPRVADHFWDHIVKLHGIPKSIISDRGAVFLSKFWTELFKNQGTKLKYSTAYHPQTDGLTERVNRCFRAVFKIIH